MTAEEQKTGASLLALVALRWTLEDEARASRFLALTGLTPEGLRERLAESSIQSAVLSFLEAHEPDLLACAAALDVNPGALVDAHRELDRG